MCNKDNLYFKETERSGDEQIVFDGGSGRWEFGWEECVQLLGGSPRWDVGVLNMFSGPVKLLEFRCHEGVEMEEALR